jgi:hypothetical protein
MPSSVSKRSRWLMLVALNQLLAALYGLWQITVGIWGGIRDALSLSFMAGASLFLLACAGAAAALLRNDPRGVKWLQWTQWPQLVTVSISGVGFKVSCGAAIWLGVAANAAIGIAAGWASDVQVRWSAVSGVQSAIALNLVAVAVLYATVRRRRQERQRERALASLEYESAVESGA